MPWFTQHELKIQNITAPSTFEKKKFFPGSGDINETRTWIENKWKDGITTLKGVFIIGAILQFILHLSLQFIGFETFILSIALHVLAWILLLSFGVAMQGVAKEFLLKDLTFDRRKILKKSLRRWPSVLLSFFAITPFFFALPYLLRAPYEAALGHSLKDAIQHSIVAGKKTKLGFSATMQILNAFVSLGFLYIAYQFVGPFSPWPWLAELAFELILASIFWGIWAECFAIHLIEDAYFNGVLNEENLSQTRTPKSTFSILYDRLMQVAPAIALIIFFVLSNKPGKVNTLTSSVNVHEWNLESLTGEKVSFSALDDRPIILSAWAPWCTPCKIEVPQIKKLDEEKGEDYYVFSVVLSYKNRTEVEEYVKSRDIKYPVLLGNDAFQRSANINAFPTVMILNKGKILQSWNGVKSASQIRAALPAR